MKRLFNYFLKPYEAESFSRRIKTRFLILTDLAIVLIFPVGLFVHSFETAPLTLYIGDIIAFASVIASLILVRAKRSELAVNILIGGIVGMLVVHDFIGDIFSAEPVFIAKVVESAFIFIVLLIIIGMTSTRRLKPLFFALAFSVIMMIQFAMISYFFYPSGVSHQDIAFLFAYVAGVLFSGFLASMMVYMTSDLVRVTEEQSGAIKEYSVYLENSIKTIREKNEEIKRINEELERRVEERTFQLTVANEELKTFNDITMQISRSLDFGEVFYMIAELLTGIYGFEECAFFSYDPDTGKVVLEKTYSVGSEEKIWNTFKNKTPGFAVKSALLQMAGLGEASVVNNDGIKPIRDPLIPAAGFLKSFPIKTLMLLPIIAMNETIGFFYLLTKRDFIRLRDDDVESMKRLANQISMMLKNAKLYAETNAMKDQLLRKNALIEEELSMARRIQMQFIPEKSPGDNIAFYYRSMEKVGGDFFDFVTLDDNRMGVFLSDVSGHGVPAAFVTSIIKTHIQQFAEHIYSPADLLFHLNNTLCRMTNDQFVTAFYGIIDVKRRTFVYCNAGHVPPLLISTEPDDPPMNLKTGVALCLCECSDMMGDKSALRYRDEKIQLRKNTKILLFTDGLLEAVRLNGKKGDFHETVMDSVLNAVKPMNATETVETIKNKLIEFRGEESFDDDICIVCVEMKSS